VRDNGLNYIINKCESYIEKGAYHKGMGSMEYVTNMTNKTYQKTSAASLILNKIPKKPKKNIALNILNLIQYSQCL
jgi:hypothetical protein